MNKLYQHPDSEQCDLKSRQTSHKLRMRRARTFATVSSVVAEEKLFPLRA